MNIKPSGILLTFLAIIRVPANGLYNLRVNIPEIAQRGRDVIFNCTYSLEADKLYAIKWYRGNYEIFRFVPSENPKKKTFPLLGFNVSVNLPDERPRITGVKDKYRIGDTITATCTSWQSHPPANLTWFINGEPARGGYLRRYDLRKEYDGTYTTVLGMHFEVLRQHMRNRVLKLKCTSTLLSVYWQSSEVEIKENAPHIGSIKESSDSSSLSNDIIEPKLKGKKKRKSKEDTSVEELTSHVLSSSAMNLLLPSVISIISSNILFFNIIL
ncbi:unnamed protein product [Lepeophtheirus salmonis]|uniref:(salmon louse) hypothetical protein n=1 Tax=Lepeophtheirus salmonis TaxID=72036 RepID=A0A7R8HEI6_LEPSM|nr:unnamed protein product [Lepeophtheirus salmonis]CAF3045434.1 unnamed protein product [Lepeophtheirus salmonis]